VGVEVEEPRQNRRRRAAGCTAGAKKAAPVIERELTRGQQGQSDVCGCDVVSGGGGEDGG